MLHNWPYGNLSMSEWEEIVALDYVLTWRYDQDGDEQRYKELTAKKWGEALNEQTATSR